MKRNVTAWLTSWALMTFGSSGLYARQIGLDLSSGAIGTVFGVADAVPPAAKIALGLSLAGWFAAVLYRPLPRVLRWSALIIGAALIFALAVLVYPFNYYPELTGQQFWPGHALAACAATGLALLMANPQGRTPGP